MEEVWKYVANSSRNTYEVSNLGRVRSIHGGTTRILLAHADRDGYHAVSTNRNLIRVHRLVALAFVENPDNLNIVDHINGNRLDNRASNLRWVDNSGNMRNPNNKKFIKEVRLFRKLTTSDIRNMLKDEVLIIELQDYKACHSAMSLITYAKNMYPRNDGMDYSASIDRNNNTITIKLV